jgi:hypothetical protein
MDFGRVEIGESNLIRNQIKNKLPINFEFEFTFTIDHPDITISPMRGIIPANSHLDIDFIYTPTSNVTIDA